MIYAIVVIVLAFAIIFYSVELKKRRRKQLIDAPINHNWASFLEANVTFYRALDDEKKEVFLRWINLFLSEKRIVAVKTTVTEEDMLLVASSAIIPIFAFPYYTYPNLTEVLIYPDRFSTDYSIEGDGRNVLGMVGTGPMEGKMILAQTALRKGFSNDNDKHNIGIHEFIHLLDKQDGSTDGLPQILMQNKISVPWIELVHQETEKIFKSKSDINPYGATNRAEFLAVIGEYFFESPEILQRKHPELYQELSEIFHQKPQLKKHKK